MQRYSLQQLKGDMLIYFTWSSNALLPIHPGAADRYLLQHKDVIKDVAAKLLQQIDYTPRILYRGIILRHPVNEIVPIPAMQYLSFTTDKTMAQHFADPDGFGSDILDVREQLGTYGYVIEYTPQPCEVLFHYSMLAILPYVEAFNHIGLNGGREVEGLIKQQEIMILQPEQPLNNITSFTKTLAQ